MHETIAQFSQMNFDRSADQQTLDNSILGLFEKNWLTQNGDIQKLGLDSKTINEFYSDNGKPVF